MRLEKCEDTRMHRPCLHFVLRLKPWRPGGPPILVSRAIQNASALPIEGELGLII